jgi:hypothetical protein
MAEELPTEDRLRIVEQLLFLILTNFGQRDAPNFRELRDLLIPSDRYHGFLPKVSPRGGLELLREHKTREELDVIPETGSRIDKLEWQQRALFKHWESLSATAREQRKLLESLRQQLTSAVDMMATLHRENVELLSVLSDSDALADERFRRVVPTSLYTSTDEPEVTDAIEKAATDVTGAVGFSVFDDQGAQSGSWIKRFFLRANEELARPEVQDRLAKVERALELKHLDTPQSKIDLDLSKAAINLRKALEGTPEGIISIGSLFAVKQTINGKAKLAILSLTQEQMQLVKSNPQMQTDPAIFHALIAAHSAHPAGSSHVVINEIPVLNTQSPRAPKAPATPALPPLEKRKTKRKSDKDTEGKTV